ncbi:hypothetical protein ACP275_08G021600 [Erythranthe tilingii]
MGCASSKEKVCRNCQAPYSPVRRSYSMHVHHPPQKTGDTYHVVALTSSTLGSLKLDPSSIQIHQIPENKDDSEESPPNHDQIVVDDNKTDAKKSAKEEFAMGMIEAKTWSNMINEKIPKIIPKTPIRTPPGEPEMINAWEMMEGLEDISPLRPPAHHFRSFSFHVPTRSSLASIDIEDQPTPRVKEESIDELFPNKPLWLDLAETDSNSNSNSNSNDTSIVSEFDPEVIASFRKALEDLPPANPFHLKSTDKIAPRGAEKLIVYFTSLRGVRKTYEDCCHVRVILKGLGVKVDERDVSMHSGFKDELKELLGEGFGKKGLPRVFLGKKCVGGADEIRKLNEDGKLEMLVERCEVVDDGGGGGGIGGGGGGGIGGAVCEACGDIRFIPCETCSGSCKIYYEGDYDEDEEEVDYSEHDEYGFQRCPDCNENGLVRCPICCD